MMTGSRALKQGLHGTSQATPQLSKGTCSVEEVTKQKNNRTRDVDGCICVLLVNFSKELKFAGAEIDWMIVVGAFNPLFL